MKMHSTGYIGKFKLPMVILGMLGAGLLLGGCAIFDGTNTPRESLPSESSEPPGIVGNPVTPLPENTTTAPAAPSPVLGADQPVSNPAAPPDKSPATAGTPDLNRPHITGHVTDSDGQPVREAILMVTRGTAEFPERTFLTDENGKYIITVPQGTFTVVANGEGFKSAEQEVTVGPGAAVLDFVLVHQ